MATESGVEGKAKIEGSPDKALKCGSWTLESMGHLAEDTNAETGGHAHRASVKKDHKLNIMVFVDGTSEQPETIGMTEGATVDMSLRVGTLNAYLAWEFIIDTVTLKGCDNNGLVTYEAVMYAQEAKPALNTWA